MKYLVSVVASNSNHLCELGVYAADNHEDAKKQAWSKYKHKFPEYEFSMLEAYPLLPNRTAADKVGST